MPDALSDGAEHLGITLDDSQLMLFEEYSRLLVDWNKKVNLTRIPASDFVPLHFLDSLSVVQLLDSQSDGESLIDIGTGAGFPAIPLKIACPKLLVTCLDSTRKKLNFIQTVIDSLSLKGISVMHARAEEAAHDSRYREKFDISTARAVARLDALAEYMLPFVKVGGMAIALKGKEAHGEAEEARQAVKNMGAEIAEIRAVEIPGSDVERNLVIVKKLKATQKKYPRAGNQIKRKQA